VQDIEIKVIKEADVNELIALYRGAGWWKEETDDVSFLPELVKNSLCFVGAFHEGKLIGMGRSIGDGISDAYIQDVTVLPEYRKRGIGGRITNTIVAFLQANGLKWIGLIGEPGTQSFYERLGFRLMKDYIPMMKKDS
jgi:aralkylamine N-acetyltransferase